MKKGFSLIELMIAMGILTIIATVSVPKVQMWNARNRGLKTVMELLSDFSKARSVAGYTVVGSNNNTIKIPTDVENPSGEKMDVFLGIRRQTAMVFGKSEYAIYQKQSMDTTKWDASALLLKKNTLLNTVTLESVNDSPITDTTTTGFKILLNFNSNGRIKTKRGYFVTEADPAQGKCGSAVDAQTLSNIVFSAIIRSRISLSSDGDSIWYRLDIDERGEYSICTIFSDDTPDFANDGALLDV